MARQTHTAKAPPSIFAAITATSANFTWTACHATDKEQVAHTGREMLLFRNTGAGARTVTVTSVADSLGRSGDISAYSIGAGLFSVLGPFPVHGWRQSDGYLYFEAEHAEVTCAVIKIPTWI